MPANGHQIAIRGRVDADLTARASEVTVEQSVGEATTFRIKFIIDICANATDLQLIDREDLLPGADHPIAVLSTVEGDTHCLVNGVITKRKLNLVHGGPGSTLEVEGQDQRIKMGRTVNPGVHSGTIAE